MQKEYLLLVSLVVIVFLISQYFGTSSFSIFNKKSIERGDSGLIATNVGSDIYIAWSEMDKKSISLASSTPKRFMIDNINDYSAIPLTRSIDASGSSVYLASIDSYLHPSKIVLSKKSMGMIDNIIIRESISFLDYPIVKSVGPAVYIVWVEYINTNYQVFLKYSHDNAKSFSEAIPISNLGYDASAVSMDVDGTNIYIAWHEVINGRHKVLFRYSHDNAKSFSEAKVVSNINAAGFPILESEGSNVYLVWIERSNNERRIVLMKSSNSGIDLEELFEIDSSSPTLPALDVDGPLVCLSWIDRDGLNLACSSNDKDFVIHRVSNDSILMHRLDVEGSNVYISWLNNGDVKEFKLRASHDAGITLNEEVSIIKGDINKAGIIASGSNLYAIWSELVCINTCTEVETNVYVRASHDAGTTFGESLLLG